MTVSFSIVLKQTLLYLKPPNNNLDAKQKVAVSYRYLSWFVTSIFYLTGPPYNSYNYKAAVVIALFVFSRVMLDYYLKSTDRESFRFNIIIETIGLTLLLVPTGGLESPFIWYALNPVLVASIYLNGFYCWLDLAFYLLASIAISLRLFNSQGLVAFEFIQNKSYIILVYILVTIVMRLLATMVKQLDQQAEELRRQKQELMTMNEELYEANSLVNRSMKHVMSLYHIIETFSSREDTATILSQLLNSTLQIMGCKVSFLWLASHKDSPSRIITQGLSSPQKNVLMNYLDSPVTLERKCVNQRSFNLEGVSYLAAAVKSTSRLYGYIGIQVSGEAPDSPRKVSLAEKSSELLSFLGDLVALILERHHLEKITSKLLILEEQNRIGNEIHDSVSQRLFSILCGLRALNVNWHRLDRQSINHQIELLEQSIKNTNSELRTSIYRLSSSKREEKVFKENINNYLRDLASLNNIRVNFEFDGDEERICSSLKQALYRIIREGTGNAVRHGRCSNLEVKLWINAAILELRIRDDGIGFNTAFTYESKDNRGLGLNNMQILTQTFNGIFELTSRESEGTTINVKFALGYALGLEANREGGAA